MKIIPAIDIMGGEVVRLYKGDPKQKTVYSNDPVSVAKQWESDGADMIHLVDLDGTIGTGSNFDIMRDIIHEIDIPVEIAGGLRTRSLICRAADICDRIVLGTIAFDDRVLFESIIDEIGPSRIVVSADHYNGSIVTHGWQQKSEIDLLAAVHDLLNLGVSEFLVTSIDRDGTLQGPDLEHLSKVCSISRANVIASGGISGIHDINELKEYNPFGVILGKALYDNKITIQEAKQC